MPDSIKTARISFVVAAGLEFATAALLVFLILAGAALIGFGTERAGLLGSALLGAAGIVLALIFAVFGAIDLFVAAGIARGRSWARYVGVAISVIYLFAVPIGTVLGVIALQGLVGRDARDWFGTPGPKSPAAPVAPPAI